MKGLILKDLYTLKKQFWFVIFFCIMYVVYGIVIINSGVYNSFIPMLLGMLSITTMSYDERSGWNGYAVSLPVKRSEIVKSKYYLSYLLIIPTGIIAFLVNITAERKINLEILTNSLTDSLFSISPVIIIMAVFLPVIFKFESEKGRIIIIVVGGVAVGIFGIFFTGYMLNKAISFMIYVPQIIMAVIALIIAVIFNLVSILISIRIYEKKEF